jgi:UDP-2,3-diacylglucosamine pyrophosphatase LpxH
MRCVSPAPLDPLYLQGVRTRLDEAFAAAEEQPLDPARDRIVVFSDHHKGVGDPADDFRRCEHAYTTALGWYLEEGYRLFVLGDAEELWEERPEHVIPRYRAVLDLEAEFARRGNGLERFFGNHDDQWASPRQVAKHLQPVLGPITVRESLRLKVGDAGTIFVIHGHQGTTQSDRWGWAARLVVRYVWRPIQRRSRAWATTPARDFALRARHDRALFEWARGRHGIVVVAGHTHRPVFGRSTPDPPATRPAAQLERALSEARAAGDTAAAAAARAELEYARTARRRPDRPLSVAPPCYFNSGCCSFPDGDITGIEVADGEIRLVRWPGALRELRGPDGAFDAGRRVLAAERLETVLAAVAAPAAAPHAEEREVRPA